MAPASSGSDTVMLPLTVRKAVVPVRVRAPRGGRYGPVHRLRTHIAQRLHGDPAVHGVGFQVSGQPRGRTLPLTVRPTNVVPVGTCTSNSTLTSLSRVFMRPSRPGMHSLAGPSAGMGRRRRWSRPPGARPPLSSRTQGRSGRARITAVTCASAPAAAAAATRPFTPLISSVCPGRPVQLKSAAEAGTSAVTRAKACSPARGRQPHRSLPPELLPGWRGGLAPQLGRSRRRRTF